MWNTLYNSSALAPISYDIIYQSYYEFLISLIIAQLCYAKLCITFLRPSWDTPIL